MTKKQNLVGSFTPPHKSLHDLLAEQVMEKLTLEHAQQTTYQRVEADDSDHAATSLPDSFYFTSGRSACPCLGCTALRQLV